MTESSDSFLAEIKRKIKNVFLRQKLKV